MRQDRPPTLAVWKFASCDGCQLTLLDCEDELTPLLGRVRIGYFLEATRGRVAGPYDVSLVEGSVTTEGDIARLHEIRANSTVLVAIGACACSGGIQALRNLADLDEYRALVYPRPEQIAALSRSEPLSAHVRVDLELRGCPIDRGQLLDVLSAYLAGRRPDLPTHSVCFACKRRGTVCLPVARRVPCLGPVTRAGCGALCPAYGRGCYGCFGPVAGANTRALCAQLRDLGVPPDDVARLFRTFNTGSAEFAAAADTAERRGDRSDRRPAASGPAR